MFKILVAFLFSFVATVIAGTRTRDYWHNIDDILTGALIGFSCSFISLCMNFLREKTIEEDRGYEEITKLYSPTDSSNVVLPQLHHATK